eukprot:COSAG02_NODE_51292_length_315_cov_0.574074_1_plen_44_part_10
MGGEVAQLRGQIQRMQHKQDSFFKGFLKKSAQIFRLFPYTTLFR